jgi:hypothetical protein
MIERILSSDLVVVDITTLNANVFYELGIRHTAQLSGTVLVHMANKPIPFNIGGMRVVEYECDTPEGIAHSQDILEANIRNSLVDRNVDSLVHALIPGLHVSRRAKPIKVTETIDFCSPGLIGVAQCRSLALVAVWRAIPLNHFPVIWHPIVGSRSAGRDRQSDLCRQDVFGGVAKFSDRAGVFPRLHGC